MRVVNSTAKTPILWGYVSRFVGETEPYEQGYGMFNYDTSRFDIPKQWVEPLKKSPDWAIIESVGYDLIERPMKRS